MKKNSSHVFVLVIAVVVVAVLSSCSKTIEAQSTCSPSRPVIGQAPPPGECNTENNSECCVEGRPYETYICSPPVGRARLTINSFEPQGDGGGEAACDNNFHSDDTMVVALSTGWFDNRRRCNQNIRINGNGQSVVAKVVDQCDSMVGCDAEHAYQPPCHNDVVDASKAVWRALGVPENSNDWGDMVVTWSDEI